ncbi:MAG: glutathione S-transferase family protein [Pseudomonadota bacterium]
MATVQFTDEFELYTYGESLCSQQATIGIVEKGVPFKSHLLTIAECGTEAGNLTPEYLQVNPKAQVPTLVHNGTPVYESYDILKYIDEQNPESGTRLYPPELREKIDLWIDDLALHDGKTIGENFGWSTGAISTGLVRACLMSQPEDVLSDNLSRHPVPERKGLYLALRENELPAPVIEFSLASIATSLNNVEKTLAENGPYLFGPFTLVDALLMASFHRLEDVRLGKILADHPALPNVSAYWKRLQARPSYKTAVLDRHHVAWRNAIEATYGDSDNPHLSKLEALLQQ